MTILNLNLMKRLLAVLASLPLLISSLALAQEQEQEVIQISVADLIRAFDENRVAAKRNYEGRTLEISESVPKVVSGPNMWYSKLIATPTLGGPHALEQDHSQGL